MAVYLAKLHLLTLLLLILISCGHGDLGDPFVPSALTGNTRTGHAKYQGLRILYYSNSYCTFQLQLIKSGDIHPNPGPCQPHDHRNSTGLNCVLLNARSVVNKTLNLQTDLALGNIDIACVTETWLCPDIMDSEILDTSHYQIFRRDRNRNGGGVLFACKPNLMPSRRGEFEPSSDIQANSKECELIWVQVILPHNKGKLLIGTCYRPPSSTTGFDEALSFSINRILPCSHQFQAIFLLGDFDLQIPCSASSDEHNPPSLNTRSAAVLNIIESLNMSQLVSFPTRRNPHGDDAMLDLIFCNDPSWTHNIRKGPGLGNSDHDSVHFQIVTTSRHQFLHRTFHQFHKVDKQDFQRTLQCIPWQLFCEDDVDETWHNFTTLIHAAVKDVVPIATSKGHRRSPWITSSIVKAARKKNRAYRRAVKNKNNTNLWDKYKELRSLVNQLTRNSYNDYIHSLALDCKENPKRFWSFVNSKRKHQSNATFNYNNQTFSDPSAIANAFNQCFQSNFSPQQSSYCLPDLESCTAHLGINPLPNFHITQADVTKAVSQLNPSKPPGLDGISPKILKLAGISIVPILTNIFNLSLSTGVVPHNWKQANVVPFFKHGDKSHITNYRPISLTSVPCKMLEGFVSKKLLDHSFQHHIIPESQHGFLPRRSCITQLTSLFDTWSRALDISNPPRIDAIFLDWSKAFDKCNHSILLHKLHQYGICGNTLSWISNFLSNREQRVIFLGASSDWIPVTSGVPQGSVLGPILFNFFTSDLPSHVKSSLPQYADDTVLYRTIRCEGDSYILQNDLNAISRWCSDNQMKLNSTKCKVMHVTRSKKLILTTYYLPDSNQPLDVVPSYKYLGVILSKDLTWTKHVNFVRAKCSRLAGFIRRTVKSKDAKVLRKLYCSLCRPILEYAAPVWLPHQKNHIQCLEAIQRRFTKSCFHYNVAISLSYEQRLSKLHLPPLYNRLAYLSASFVIKCLFNRISVSSHFLPQANTRKTDTLLFKHQYSRTNCVKFSLFTVFPRFFNSLPSDVRDLCLELSPKPFINSLRDYLSSLDPITHPF